MRDDAWIIHLLAKILSRVPGFPAPSCGHKSRGEYNLKNQKLFRSPKNFSRQTENVR